MLMSYECVFLTMLIVLLLASCVSLLRCLSFTKFARSSTEYDKNR